MKLEFSVRALSAVVLFSGVTVMFGVGTEVLGAKVPSPPYWAVTVYEPPGKLLIVEETAPPLRVKNPGAWWLLVKREMSPVGVPGPPLGATAAVTFTA